MTAGQQTEHRPAPWLGPSDVLAHIGVHKSGTSAIQHALAHNRDALRRLGVTYPGKGLSHHGAALHAVGKVRGWDADGNSPSAQWENVGGQVRATRGRVVVSAEALCEADAEQIAGIVRDLGGERVRIVVVLRPIEQLLPSNWQQAVKSGMRSTYRRWLRKVLREVDGTVSTDRTFWKRNDHGALVERWVAAVGTDRMRVVVLDPSDRMHLFETFEELMGLPRRTLVPAPDARTNRSLSANEIEVIRSLNEWAVTSLSHDTYHHLLRKGGIEMLVEGRVPGEREEVLTVPQWVVERARQHSRRAIERIAATGVPVLGSLEQLCPTGSVEPLRLVKPTMTPVEVAHLLLQGVLAVADEVIDWNAPNARQRAVAAREVRIRR